MCAEPRTAVGWYWQLLKVCNHHKLPVAKYEGHPSPLSSMTCVQQLAPISFFVVAIVSFYFMHMGALAACTMYYVCVLSV